MTKSFYFQHDYNACSDVKVLFLREQLGMEGYGIYWFILEQLAQSGGYLPLKIIPVLAMQCQTQEVKLAAVVKEFELFEIHDNKFFSNRLNKQLQYRELLSEKGKIGAINRWGTSNDQYDRKKALRSAQKIESHTPEEWNEMLIHFNYSCAKCGSEGVLKDHIIPLYKGGLDGINNIQPLCKKCNSSKGSDTTDYRLNHKNCPEKWFKNGEASSPGSGEGTAKERKGKEIKEKKRNITPTGDTHTPEQIERFEKFTEWVKENFPRVANMKKPFTIDQYLKLRETISREVLTKLLTAMENRADLHKKYVSAYLTIINWSKNEFNQPEQRPEQGSVLTALKNFKAKEDAA
jgi:hypothetical protein